MRKCSGQWKLDKEKAEEEDQEQEQREQLVLAASSCLQLLGVGHPSSHIRRLEDSELTVLVTVHAVQRTTTQR
jgi:hypothetical protein